MKIQNTLFMLLATLALSGCMTPKSIPTLTPLEIQSLQSREYETTKEVVFPSVISVFQDLGYTISNAEIQTGLISAESLAKSYFNTTTRTKATAFVEQIGDKTKVRLNFVEVNKKSAIYGQFSRQDTALLDAKLYQNAFEKIENVIFIRSAK